MCLINEVCDMIFFFLVIGGVTSMDSFLKEFFPSVYEQESTMKASTDSYCKFNSQILTLFTSSLYLTALVAGLVASSITRLMGRRATMIIGGIFFVLGALLNGLATGLWMLIVGRMLLGFGIGCANQVVTIIMRSVTNKLKHTSFNALFTIT